MKPCTGQRSKCVSLPGQPGRRNTDIDGDTEGRKKVKASQFAQIQTESQSNKLAFR